MITVLTGLNGIKAFVYLDDIIIYYAQNLTDHSKKLEEDFKSYLKLNRIITPQTNIYER